MLEERQYLEAAIEFIRSRMKQCAECAEFKRMRQSVIDQSIAAGPRAGGTKSNRRREGGAGRG